VKPCLRKKNECLYQAIEGNTKTCEASKQIFKTCEYCGQGKKPWSQILKEKQMHDNILRKHGRI